MTKPNPPISSGGGDISIIETHLDALKGTIPKLIPTQKGGEKAAELLCAATVYEYAKLLDLERATGKPLIDIFQSDSVSLRIITAVATASEKIIEVVSDPKKNEAHLDGLLDLLITQIQREQIRLPDIETALSQVHNHPYVSKGYKSNFYTIIQAHLRTKANYRVLLGSIEKLNKSLSE